MSVDPGWSIIESSFNPATFKAYEGLFTLGSGYLHVRGSLEEHLSDAPQNVSYTRMPANVTSEKFRDTKSKWGTYVPGIFGKHPLLNNEMINLPYFLGMTPIVDGERLDVEKCQIEDYRRELWLDTATLIRTLRWRTQTGKLVSLEFERFVSAARPHLCAQRLRVASDSWVQLELRAGLDADVRTNGYDHFQQVQFLEAPDDLVADVGVRTCSCTILTDADERVSLVSELRYPFGTRIQYRSRDRQCELVASSSGKELIFEKRSSVCTSRDGSFKSAEDVLADASSLTYRQLHAEHAEVWRKQWEASDVVIEGDPESQLAMRVSLFHLLRAHVDDPRVAIDAKGYAGEAYWGRYFWDTEVYLLPFFLYTDPQKARTLTDFRVQSLPGAKANAARYGCPGARYAWESDAGGYECCPNWQYADHEIHVTADVVYGLAHYAEATDRHDYLAGEAADVILETARYWLARVDQREGDDYFSLLGVMGPDEYTPISGNNSYTNRMVAFALDLAAQVGEAVGAPQEEYEQFARVSELLPLVYDSENQLVMQCEEFAKLADPRFEELWKDRSKTFASQVSQERLYRGKCLKQADVLMLMMLFPDQFTEEEVRQAWDYYLPYTTHDSSLSPGAHAIVALRLGLTNEAWEFWQKGKGLDLDIAHGGAAEGIHIANAGAVWQMAVFGFAGMATALQAERLTLRPKLPAAWSRLAFPIVWKGCPVYVDITRDRVVVSNRGGEPMEVQVGDEVQTIEAGGSSEWEV